MKSKKIIRDISWLSFNNRVLQEAKDSSVHLYNRLRFLGIFSNNLDEFFRVRVGTLNKMLKLDNTQKIHVEDHPEKILKQIQVLSETVEQTLVQMLLDLQYSLVILTMFVSPMVMSDTPQTLAYQIN